MPVIPSTNPAWIECDQSFSPGKPLCRWAEAIVLSLDVKNVYIRIDIKQLNVNIYIDISINEVYFKLNYQKPHVKL